MKSDAITPQILKAAARMRQMGMGWETIARDLGVACDGLRRRMDPKYTVKRNRQIAEARERRVMFNRTARKPNHMSPEQVERLVGSVPTDTRSRVARWLGDPPSGRSALDRRDHHA